MNFGAARWIGERFLALTGPASSTGSPTTFRMRPSTSGPTGIVIGAPVFLTGMPRTRPSVVSIATQRTVLLAEVLRDLDDQVVVAVVDRRVGEQERGVDLGQLGRSNSTSTTGPMTWTTRPIELGDKVGSHDALPLERLGAADDLDQLLGDRRLASAVVLKRERSIMSPAFLRRVVHRGHAGRRDRDAIDSSAAR